MPSKGPTAWWQAPSDGSFERLTAASSNHLYQLDFIRALTVFGVITVHVTFFTHSEQSTLAGAGVMVLHYTREVFLFLTGFVLFYRYPQRVISWGSFWRKRFTLIAIPYVLWSVIYAYVGLEPTWNHALPFLRSLGVDLLTGQAWYHLYYLLITMQIYLLFPGLKWLIARTRRRHGLLLAVSIGLELLLMAGYQHGLPQGGAIAVLGRYRALTFLTYQLYILSGAMAATYLPHLHRWITRHRTYIVAGWLATLVAALSTYVLNREGYHLSVLAASSVFQPVMVPYCLATTLFFYTLGWRWSEGGRSGLFGRIIMSLSHHSFGLYLLHPLVLYVLLGFLPRLVGPYGSMLETGMVVMATLTVSYLVVSALAFTPASLYLLGQKRRPLIFRNPLQPHDSPIPRPGLSDPRGSE